MLFDDPGKKVLDEKKNPWVDFTSLKSTNRHFGKVCLISIVNHRWYFSLNTKLPSFVNSTHLKANSYHFDFLNPRIPEPLSLL